jgi:hypothetical protein
LTALIHDQIKTFGMAADGRLFRGERNEDHLPKGTFNRAWRRTRAEVFPARVGGMTRATLWSRHGSMRFELNADVPPADVAWWAGHSVEVLLNTYVKCLDGGTELLRPRVQAPLGHGGLSGRRTWPCICRERPQRVATTP